MKCPYCGSNLRPGALYCPECKQPLPIGAEEEVSTLPPRFYERWYFRALFLVVCILLTVGIVGVGVYKLYYWVDSYKTTRAYTRGAQTPVVSPVTLEDGRPGHAISFFGEDGGQIYIPELNLSTFISGNVARVEIPDGTWFAPEIVDIESAEVSLSPTLIRENGDRVRLPQLEFTVDAPASPVTIISPEKDNINVSTAVYPLEVQVVPGSTVYINGEDETDMVDRAGLLSANLNIYPIGDNVITLLVRTPNHLETRADITIYRAQLEIEVELDTSVQVESSSRYMNVSGRTEPNAEISVDTPHVAQSVYIDQETGRFSFMTDFQTYGDNIVRFRITKEDKEDSVISFTVQYKPTLADYGDRAWAMDYANLKKLFEQWKGRVFLCEGEVLDVFVEDEKQYVVMDVGTDGASNLVVLINESSIGTPVAGREYTAYAHVEGRYMYHSSYYPLLTTLYMDVRKVD